MMNEFEKDKKSVRRSVHFNAEQKGRVQQLGDRLGYPDNLSRTVNTAVYLASCFLDIRDRKKKEIKSEIKDWNLTIPEIFEIGEVRTLYDLQSKEGKKKILTLSEQKRG